MLSLGDLSGQFRLSILSFECVSENFLENYRIIHFFRKSLEDKSCLFMPERFIQFYKEIIKSCLCALLALNFSIVVDSWTLMSIHYNSGEMIDKFRKIHLFDIDIPGKITFKGWR